MGGLEVGLLDCWDAVDKEESSDGKGARRMIFLERREESGRMGFGKGYLRMPSFGVIMNFWWAWGMEREV